MVGHNEYITGVYYYFLENKEGDIKRKETNYVKMTTVLVCMKPGTKLKPVMIFEKRGLPKRE